VSIVSTKSIEIRTDEEIKACVSCLNDAFYCIATTYGLTKDNAPNNGAFLDFGKLKSEMSKGVSMIAISQEDAVNLDEKTIVGCAGFRILSSQKAEIVRLAVHSSYKGQGYGKDLITRIEKILIAHGITEIALGCIAEDQNLIGFYQSLGYSVKKIKQFKKHLHGVCFMVKRV